MGPGLAELVAGSSFSGALGTKKDDDINLCTALSTEFDDGASCNHGRKGAWPLKGRQAASMADATAACLALCLGCARCRYISVARAECRFGPAGDAHGLPTASSHV